MRIHAAVSRPQQARRPPGACDGLGLALVSIAGLIGGPPKTRFGELLKAGSCEKKTDSFLLIMK
eukprot:901240-Lingulodinium_polyedra.AAC.1